MAALQAVIAVSGAKKTSLKRAVLEATFAIRKIRLQLIHWCNDNGQRREDFQSTEVGLENQVNPMAANVEGITHPMGHLVALVLIQP